MSFAGIQGFATKTHLQVAEGILDVKLHCIAEISAYWVDTKPSEIDNPRHHYQIA